MDYGLGGNIPSMQDLERHYLELAEQKRKMEEMVDRTSQMMAGVGKGIEEMQTKQQDLLNQVPRSRSP